MLGRCVINFGTSSAKQQHEMTKLRFCGEREHTRPINHSLSQFASRSHQFCSRIVRLHCTSQTNWNNRQVVQVTRTCIVKFSLALRSWFLKVPYNHDGQVTRQVLLIAIYIVFKTHQNRFHRESSESCSFLQACAVRGRGFWIQDWHSRTEPPI